MDNLKLVLKPDQKIWFSGCLHINHKNICGPTLSNWDSGYRDFDSLEKMNAEIIGGINKYVAPTDILVDLGDMFFGDSKLIPKFRSEINCQTIFAVQGNHTLKMHKYRECFADIIERADLSIEFYTDDNCYKKRKIHAIIGHYPELSWLGMGKGYWMLHSHCHNAPIIRELNTKCKRFETSMDHAYWLTGEYKPFSLQDLIEIQDAKPVYNVDHHDINCNIR